MCRLKMHEKDLGNFYEVEFISCILDSSLVSKVAKSNSLANNHIETVQFPSENSKILEVVFANFKIMLIHEVKRHLKLNSADQMTEVYKHSRCVPGTKREERIEGGKSFLNFAAGAGPSIIWWTAKCSLFVLLLLLCVCDAFSK